MKTGSLVLLALAMLLGCDSATKPTSTPPNTVRSYNGTASVGDFLTISIDSIAQTITYKNYSNSTTGTMSYTVNADGTYTISDPNDNCSRPTKCPGS
jgi:hypothetical protein